MPWLKLQEWWQKRKPQPFGGFLFIVDGENPKGRTLLSYGFQNDEGRSFVEVFNSFYENIERNIA